MNVLLADDHDLVRDALSALLKQHDPDLTVITAEDLPAALQVIRSESEIDIAILDLRMPGMNGLAGLDAVLRAAADLPVIILSGSASRHDVTAALKLGAKGFLPKTMAGKSLLNAIRLVASGEIYVPAGLMTGRPPQGRPGVTMDLSDRERQVLDQLRTGTTNKDISRVLQISETTVKMHIRAIGQKLMARNRTEIVTKALERGLLQ